MIFKTADASALTDAEIQNYYSMLSDRKKQTLANLPGAAERRLYLAGEIAARRGLSELTGAPEFAFELLINMNGVCAVGNFGAKLGVCSAGNRAFSAVSLYPVGIAAALPEEFCARDTSGIITDAELRQILSLTNISMLDFVNGEICRKKEACIHFAALKCLKEAYFLMKGTRLSKKSLSVEFLKKADSFECSGPSVKTNVFAAADGTVAAVTEEIKE